MGGPVPHVKMTAIFTLRHVAGVEALQEALRFPPLGAHHHIVTWLVPEVIAKGSVVAGGFPVALDLESFAINQNKTSCHVYQ